MKVKRHLAAMELTPLHLRGSVSSAAKLTAEMVSVFQHFCVLDFARRPLPTANFFR